MKKIIAILLALALVSTMAFAQSVSISNTLSTTPYIVIDGGVQTWGFDSVLSEQVAGTAETSDGRAKVSGDVTFNLDWLGRDGNQVLTPTPRWKFSNGGSNFSALLKPIDHLEVYVTNCWRISKSVAGPGIAWLGTYAGYGYKNKNTDVLLLGKDGKLAGNSMDSGVYVGYNLLDDHLWVGGGLATTTWIKKGVYGPFQLGVNYSSDVFSVGARWKGQFGGWNVSTDPTEINHTDKRYYDHSFYVGTTLNFLKDAKIGTTFGVGFSFNTAKASNLLNKVKQTSFAGTVEASFDFRNGVKDTLDVTVGYANIGGVKSKSLPFYVGNTLKFAPSDSASFSLFTGYAQGAFPDKSKVYTTNSVTLGMTGGVMQAIASNSTPFESLNGQKGFISEIVINPSFTWSNGPHSFTMGVKADVFNNMQHYNKTDTDWAYTAIRGIAARIMMPLSWTYNF